MRSNEFIIEGFNHPVIVVDVQPEYAYYDNNQQVCDKIVHFVNKQTGPVLMFINAEDTGVSDDTKEEIVRYWEQVEAEGQDIDLDDMFDNDPYYTGPIDWNRFTVVDKGYGYLRSWMDHGLADATIIRVIREMYQLKISDSRDFENSSVNLEELVGNEWDAWMWSSSLTVNWTSVAQLKRFSGAYIVGGGRNECLREVELLMNAFNIKYRRVDSLVY